MSESKKPKDIYSLVMAFYHWTYSELHGEHGGPRRTWFARLVALLLVLQLGGPLLWAALKSMPTPLAVFIALVMVGRIGLWYWRRGR